jgi:hypothetical protein
VSSSKPVVVYGASGYTGRLVCEYLREYGLPFIAAGRSRDRLQSAMDHNVPGIETAGCEVVAVDHTVDALTELFTGARVVCNTVGPFAKYGHEVVEACLDAGCHYLDTTGEQDWVIECDETYGERMADKGLLLGPGVAQMYTTGEIAANICLETPGLDTLDVLVFWKGSPTIASTQTIFVNAALAKAYYLEQNEYVEWPADGSLYDVTVPGSTRPASRCRGAARRTRCGSGATRAWPTSRCSAASSTAGSCRACPRSWARSWRRSGACPTRRSTECCPSRRRR